VRVERQKQPGSRVWNVQVRRTSGEMIRRSLARPGDTLSFKKLDPGFYVVCLASTDHPDVCQSVDANLPDDGKSYTVQKKLEVPASPPVGRKDVHQVSAVTLAVPARAKREAARAAEERARGNDDLALQHLERALEIYPGYADAINNIGVYYHRKGDYSKAIRHFTRATEIDPGYFPGWANLGSSLTAAGDLVQALEANRHALEIRPRDPVANSQMGMTYFYLRDFPKAKECFLKVAEMDPSHSSTPNLFLAHIAVLEQDTGVALTQIRKFLELHPHSPHAPRAQRLLQQILGSGQDLRAGTPHP